MPEERDMTQEEYEEEQYIQRAFAEFKQKRRARRIRKIVIAAVLLLMAAGGVTAYLLTHGQQEEETVAEDTADVFMSTAEVRRGHLTSTIRAEGITSPLQITGVESQVSGTILQVMVNEGDLVQKGDVLFTITNEDYYNKVRESEAKIKETNEALAEAQQQFQDTYKKYDTAYNEAGRSDDWDGLDTYEQEVKDADTAVQKAKGAVEAAQASHNALLAASQQDSVKSIQASISGNVIKMQAKPGDKVEASSQSSGSSSGSSESSSQSNDSLVQIVDISQMMVVVQVNEIDIAKVKEGQTVKLTFPALTGVESMGSVQKVASVASGYDSSGNDSYLGSGGGVVTYSVTILIPMPDPQLKMGMTATAEIEAEGATEGFIIPEEAIQEGEDGGAYVSVVNEGGETTDVPIKIVEGGSSESVVEGELNEGDLVVTTGFAGASDDEGFDDEFGDDDEEYYEE